MRVLLLIAAITAITGPASAAWNPPDVDLTRPRLLLRAGDISTVQQRVDRDPYRQIIVTMMNRTRLADGVALDDHTIGSERNKARAAKNLAFLYAIDRTLSDGEVVPFPSAAERSAVGERVRDLLVNLYPRSRLAVPPPLGNWDRDINTSEELLQYATAYDTMLGAGFDFGSDDAVIVNRLADLASELYDNYVHPETANNYALLHQNNHRSKTGAALVMAGIALAEYTAAPGSDPRGIREPSAWIDHGLDLIDLILRYALVTGDGAYGEGPFYLRYTAQNILPFARAWDRLVGRDWVAGDLTIPNFWRHPLFLRSQRWVLDMTLPDGSLAPFDDGNPGRAYYFGAAPLESDTAAAFAWRWANAPAIYEADGSVDLAADAIVNFDDAVQGAPPASSPTAFYFEGGNAVFRSDWSPDAVHAVVLGEHDTASEFGRDRDGRGVAPESHEHAEPGSFLLHAFGEVLALDPGYLDFGARTMVNQPQHHNLILVDGKGPIDYLFASLEWQNRDLTKRPPADGQATLSDAVDTGFVDAVRVTSRYGQPAARAGLISRRFLFVDNRYLVIADDVRGPGNPAATFTWLLHGNGGGDSGGAFEQQPNGGRWTRTAARLDSVIALNGAPPQFATETAIHEAPGRAQRTHTVLTTEKGGRQLRSVQVLYPSPSEQAPPEVATSSTDARAAVVLVDEENDRRVAAFHTGGTTDVTPPRFERIVTDGDIVLCDIHLDGKLRMLWADSASTLAYGSIEMLTGDVGTLGIALSEARIEIVALTRDAAVRLHGLPFTPRAIDGGCGGSVEDGTFQVHLGRERRVVLRPDDGNAQPAADPGADQRVPVGTRVLLDGRASCDSNGDALTPRWELTSAPAGSSWHLTDADTWSPSFQAERAGPYRLRLVVTDTRGLASRPADVLVIAGDRCADDIDDDLDGLFDSDDPDCDTSVTSPNSGCVGDCSNRSAVDVSNLVLCVNIALSGTGLPACMACDGDGDGKVAVNELVAGVNNALRGCPS